MRHAFATALVVLTVVLPACSAGTMTAIVHPAANVPFRFDPQDQSIRLAQADTLAGDGCRSPLVDPRDGTVITFLRSTTDYGDYQVPRGHYGVKEGELLRIECNTGRALGVVPR